MAYNNQYPGYQAPAPAGQTVTAQKTPQQQAMDDAIKAALAAEEQKKESYKKEMAAQGLNADGSPIRQAFDSLVDPVTGKLKNNYNMNIQSLDPSQWGGYQQYKTEAMRTGPSAWANLQQQAVQNQTLANKESAARQAMSGMNQGLAGLAMRGGMSAGARGLAARSAGRDLLSARQSASRAGDVNSLGVSTTDEGNRIAQLANLAASESDIGKYNKTLEGKQQEYNINNLMHEQDSKRSYNDMTYQEQMKKWAAAKQADATAKSGGGGGGGCFITTAVCEYLNLPDDNPILNEFRKFRDEHMGGKEALKEYYDIAPKIVSEIKSSGHEDWMYGYLLTQYLIPCLIAIKAKKYKKAEVLYSRMIRELKEDYLEVPDVAESVG